MKVYGQNQRSSSSNLRAHGNVERRRPKARALSAPKESNVPQNRLLLLN
jgi:hypothetical protein